MPLALVHSAEPMAAGGGSAANDDDSRYLSVAKLKKQYYDYLGAKTAEIEEARQSRHYYHGDQWTETEIATLQRRKQPVVTSNRIERKINAVVGIVEKLRQDPKAYARTPQHEQGADVATAVMRYCLDNNDWKSKSTRNARLGAVDGIAGIEFDLEKGDHGDPDLALHIVYADTFFYDPRSFDEGFTDARYMGIAKWIDVDQAKELIPSKASVIDELMEEGSDITSAADQDRERVWVNTSLKRLRMVDHWYICKGQWCWTLYIGSSVMMQGVSPFRDKKGKTFPRFLMFSANVDHDGDRYGFIRNLKSPQDEVNHRRSKALFKLNARGIIAEKGAFDDIEIARREAAKADMFLEKNPGMEVEFDDSAKYADFKGQLEMLQEAKNEIENFGPNPALIGQGLEDSSGRAIALLQQAGMAELGPYLSAYKNWKIRVYRAIWDIITEHWKAERWIRVTDDQNVAQFFQINKLDKDQYGNPAIVNAIGSMDVDFIVDEGPDTINQQADSAATLQALGPQFSQQFPELAIELSPLEARVKTLMLKKIKERQAQPPPPDPKVLALQAQMQLEQQAAASEEQRRAAEFQAEQQRKQAQLQHDTELEQVRTASKIQLSREEAAAKINLQRETAAAQIHLEREKTGQQLELEGVRNQQQTAMEREKMDHSHDLAKKEHKFKTSMARREAGDYVDDEGDVAIPAPMKAAIDELRQGIADAKKAATAPRRTKLIRDAKGRPVEAVSMVEAT